MKNFLGALFGIIVGSFAIVNFIQVSKPLYPPPYDILWILFAGSQALQLTGQQLLDIEKTLGYIVTWLIIGVVASPFSNSRWSTVRTAFWIGVFITLFALVSILLLNPAFWLSETRNWELLIQFVTSILTSFLSMISSLPLVMLLLKIKERSESPVPI